MYVYYCPHAHSCAVQSFLCLISFFRLLPATLFSSLPMPAKMAEANENPKKSPRPPPTALTKLCPDMIRCRLNRVTSVLWCMKKDLGFSTHRKKRMKKLERKMKHGNAKVKRNPFSFKDQ